MALIVNELRGGEMPRAAELRGRQDRAFRAFDRFGHDDAIDRWPASPARDLRAKREHLVVVADKRRAVDRGEAGDGVDGAAQIFLPFVSDSALGAFALDDSARSV